MNKAAYRTKSKQVVAATKEFIGHGLNEEVTGALVKLGAANIETNCGCFYDENGYCGGDNILSFNYLGRRIDTDGNNWWLDHKHQKTLDLSR